MARWFLLYFCGSVRSRPGKGIYQDTGITPPEDLWRGGTWTVGLSRRKFRGNYKENFINFALTIIWSVVRVARNRSAKPGTAVRIRHRPQQNPRARSAPGFFVFWPRHACIAEGRKQKRPMTAEGGQGILLQQPPQRIMSPARRGE